MDTDRWVTCSCGARHWGARGAAGLLLIDGLGRVLLHKRAGGSDFGGTWGVPGGAKSEGETDSAAALREAAEEVAGLDPALVSLVDSYVERHGSKWSYVTFVARVTGTPARSRCPPRATSSALTAGAETAELAWVAVPDVAGRRLLPGFAASWRDGLRGKVEAQSKRLTVEGWRCFAVDDQGRLSSPFMLRYRPDRSEPLDGRQSSARCVDHVDHAPPVAGCTCGLRAVVDLSALLEAVTTRTFAGSTASILDEAGVLARVRLLGEVLPGVDIPDDDPPTTWRGAGMEVLEIHLSPALGGRADQLAEKYQVPTASYDRDEWPGCVAQLDQDAIKPLPQEDVAGFRAELELNGFGSKDTADPIFVKVGKDLCTMLRAGNSRADAVRAMYDAPGQPSLQQARDFVTAAVAHLCSDCVHAPIAPMFAKPVTRGEDLRRSMAGVIRR